MTSLRSSAAGMASQLLNAGTNVVTAFAASVVLAPESFGLFVLGFAVVTIALATGRGLIGQTMLTQLPATPEGDRPALVRSAVGFAVLVGGLGTVALLVVSQWIGSVVWFVPWLVLALVQDVGRYAFLALGRAVAALVLDVVWAAAQAVLVVGWWLIGGALGIGVFATAWGVGALAGAVAFAALARHSAVPAGPGPWLRSTRDVAGWFTAMSVLGQLEVYLVILLAGALAGARDAGGLRAVQLLVFQPPMVLLGAVLALATPPVARLGAGSSGLPSVWRLTALAVTPVAAVVLVVATLAGPVMGFLFPQYTDYSDLVLPVALQSALAAFAVPTLALLAGTRRAGLAFGLQTGRSILLLVGVVVGAIVAGTHGLAWSLAISGAVTLAVGTYIAWSVLTTVPAREAVPA
ncbi:hypothetical protein WCD74_01385 [Actinomycetospora sp. OC33-EN08]|uniref:Membrane protein involved in the export of O-antigen and teichoic acid n=1 Tax=Actinomycetospora aurantiaca TaxID=3129233 RepID=A0ABU8MH13_9PSEU